MSVANEETVRLASKAAGSGKRGRWRLVLVTDTGFEVMTISADMPAPPAFMTS
jgi:hypothetical protein